MEQEEFKCKNAHECGIGAHHALPPTTAESMHVCYIDRLEYRHGASVTKREWDSRRRTNKLRQIRHDKP